MKKIVKKALKIFAVALLAVIAAVCGGYGVLSAITPNPADIRAERIGDPTGYVIARGKNIYDPSGKLLFFKGINLGDWFIQEYWMATAGLGFKTDTDEKKVFETGIYTQKRGLAAMRANQNLTDAQIRELDALYIDNFIKEEDFAIIAGLNLNCVRINFSCYNMTTDGYNIDETAFEKIDWALDMCGKYGLYAILDDHGAIGSQNMDNHSGNDQTFELYGNEKNENATVAMWEYIASRYKGKYANVLAAYDLLNEPRSAPHKFTGKVNFDFYDRLYKAIRAIDPERMLIMECFTFPAHGIHESVYGWENVSYSYHFYNLTPFSDGFAVNFYRVLHNLMGYDVPIIIGEFSAWESKDGWNDLMDAFDEWGWSYLSWTYKTNEYIHKQGVPSRRAVLWGVVQLDIKPVNVYTATYDEIYAVYSSVGTENAKKTVIYDVFKQRFGGKE